MSNLDEFHRMYKTAIRTTRDAVVRPKPRLMPAWLWKKIACRVINFQNVPLGTITEVVLQNGVSQATIMLAGQKEGINARETTKD